MTEEVKDGNGNGKKKMGRPKTEIDWVLVESLANIQCTIAEIAGVLKIPISTLSGREEFSSIYKNGQENGKSSLRRLQWHHAEKSPAMAIFLGKQYLGQSDKVEIDPGEAFKGELAIFDDRNVTHNRVKDFIN